MVENGGKMDFRGYLVGNGFPRIIRHSPTTILIGRMDSYLQYAFYILFVHFIYYLLKFIGIYIQYS